MKIAFDVDVDVDVDVIKDLGITKMVRQVADWGYDYIEQSPHPQLNPFYKHPKAGREIVVEYKKALKETGIEISSFIVVYRWSGPLEARRQAAVIHWKRMIEITVEMGVSVINTKLSGDPNKPEVCEEMWYRSMEELLPIIEREGIRIEIQSHSWDFCEENNETADLVKSLRSDNVKYLYSVPHTFFYNKGKGDAEICRRRSLPCIGCRYYESHQTLPVYRQSTGGRCSYSSTCWYWRRGSRFPCLIPDTRDMDFANRIFNVGG